MRNKFAIVVVVAVCGVLISSVAFAQADIGFKGIGGRVGLIDAEGIDATIGFEAMVALGTIIPDLAWEASIGYWSKSEDIPRTNDEVSFRDLSIRSRVKYMFPVDNAQVKPYAGGGLGLHFVKIEAPIETPAGTLDAENTDTEIGLDLGGGVAFAINANSDVFAELWYTVVSDANQLAVVGGYVFWFE